MLKIKKFLDNTLWYVIGLLVVLGAAAFLQDIVGLSEYQVTLIFVAVLILDNERLRQERAQQAQAELEDRLSHRLRRS